MIRAAKTRLRALKPTEHQIQAAYFDLVRLHMPHCRLIYANPNAAKRSYALAARMKREGLMPGVLDVNIDIPRGSCHGMRIEFKRNEKQKLTAAQKKMWEALTENNYLCQLHWNAEEAWKSTIGYLSLK